MINIENTVVYDIESFPNVFSLDMECLFSDVRAVWEISHFRDDRHLLMQWFNGLIANQTPMLGFNNLHYDYPVIHYIFKHPNATVEEIYAFSQNILNSDDRWGHQVWASDRFAPQIDVFKINHFDNMAKTTNLKALQINMRSENVVEMPIPFGTVLTEQETNDVLIPYGKHDSSQTKRFALFNIEAIKFRVSLIEQFGLDVMNWPDTKIGSRMMEQKIGEEICYDKSSGRKKPRQTPRSVINIGEIIFPFVHFDNPEFQRVHQYLNAQVLRSADIKEFNEVPKVQTKGVFTDLKANVGGIDFHFGTGGIHASVSAQKIVATDTYIIRDIDIAQMYPRTAIANNLAPEHLGSRFTEVYSDLPAERKRWQIEKGKKCVEANAVKLASNGVYGNSNNAYSVFYDPKFTLTITINGQLLLCMLAEKLATVPTLSIIQVNTDGITYYVHKDYEPHAAQHCREWEDKTKYVLEGADYSRMWIRDVNNYIAEDKDGSLKLKGAYWTPDATNYHESISQAQPPAWHKDLSNLVSVRAAVVHMIHGVDIEQFIRMTTNPYDFMCRIKTKRADTLIYGGQEIQRNTRYYVSASGLPLKKMSPPAGPVGTYKRAPKITKAEYERVMLETGGQWDERVCTKNKSLYEIRETNIQAGHMVNVCNNVQDFDFNTIDYNWYINEARKLVIQ
jgi:hypothetical protein